MNKQYIQIDCPICGSKKSTGFLSTFDRFDTGRTKWFQLEKCDRCGFIYLNPRPDESEMGNFYKSAQYDPFISDARREGLHEIIYKIVRELNLKSKIRKIQRAGIDSKVLDVGCATGEFLESMKHNGWQVEGVETDIEARKFSESKGVKVYNSLRNVDGHSVYDIITFWHVLEHVYDLKDTLRRISELLKPGGNLIVALPNIMCTGASRYGIYWVALDAPRHLYHFSPDSILKIVTQNGFRFTGSWTLISDFFYNYLESRSLKHNLLGGWFEMMTGLLLSLSKVVISSRRYASSLVYNFKKEH